MEATRWPLEKLVGRFAGGEILLPEMQRGYVWTPEKARALIDSVYRGYPSGSILLWEAGGPAGARGAAAAAGGRGGGGESHLLLDGQQRLASLSAAMSGVAVRTRRGGAVREARIDVCFNMDHPDGPADPDGEGAGGGRAAFRLKGPATAGDPRWVDVARLFREGPVAVLAERADPGDPGYHGRLDRLSRLYNTPATYFYPVQVLGRGTPYAEAADVFVRINSQGSGVRRSDLALALVAGRWRGSVGLFSAMSAECRGRGYDLDAGFLLRCMASVSAGRSGPEGISGAPMRQIRDSWERTAPALRFAIGFLRGSAGVDTTGILPSKSLVIPVVCAAAKHGCRFTPALGGMITRWFCAALVWGRYSGGSAGAALDEDLGLIRDCGRPVERMMEKIRLRSGRLEVRGEDLAGSTVKSPFFSAMYVLARRAGARDWISGRAIGAGAGAGAGAKPRHGRVFDQGVLRGPLRRKYGDSGKARRLASDIANVVFVGGRHGRGRAGPREYLKGVAETMGEGALEAQCVPVDPALWRADRYEDFLRRRRDAIAASINELVGSPG